jgi:uracil-DNA glycosylase family 4
VKRESTISLLKRSKDPVAKALVRMREVNPLPVSTYDLAHAQRMGAKCNECPLRGRPLVPPSGPKTARLAVVGEAPGWSEAHAEKPEGFIGPSGRILNKLLAANKLRRENVAIQNAALCFPSGAIKPGSTSEEMDPKAVKIAMKCCRPRLIRELAEMKKLKVIAPLGAIAVRSLTNRKTLGILKARGFVWDPIPETEKVKVKKKLKDGRVKEVSKVVPARYAVNPRVKILPSLHPAFVLRAPNWRPVIEFDFNRIARALRGKLEMVHLKGVLGPKAGRVRAELAKLGPVVSVDVETTKEKPTTARLLCIGISDGRRSTVIPWASTKSINRPFYNGKQGGVGVAVRKALLARTCVTQNGPGFDHIVLSRHGIELTKAQGWEDTLLAHHAFASHMPQRLDHIVSMYLDMPPWKITTKRAAKADEKGAWDPEKLENEELWSYNQADGCTKIVWDQMQPDLEPEREVYKADKRLALLCRGMQEHGFAIDNERRTVLRDELRGREANALGRLRKIARFPELRPTRLKDVREALFERLGAPVLFRNVISKTPSTGADTLQALAAMDSSAGEFCRTMLKWRDAQKLRSTYVDGIHPESDGRVHPSWKSFGTVSGRFSAREPAIQTLKRGDSIRSMYVSPKNRRLVAFDFDQLEMKQAAFLSGDEAFIESCLSEDIHASNGAILFEGMPEKYLTADDAKERKVNPEFKRLRDMAKESGFAVAYLAEPETVHSNMLKKGFRIGLLQVRAMLNRMRARYHRYYEWQEENLRFVQENGYLRTWDGRMRWFGFEPSPTETANFPIQGGAAGLMNRVLPEIEDALPRSAFLVAQVHDAGYIECDPGDVDRIVRTCKRIAEAPVELPNGVKAKYTITIKSGVRWSELG